MSTYSIASFFPFSQVRITGQSVSNNADLAEITIAPDRRFHTRCPHCGSQGGRIHDNAMRVIRDLNIASAMVLLRCHYRKIWCDKCNGVVVEDLGLFNPYQRVTKRLARTIHELCKVMTVSDVARHYGLNWKTVKNIDKTFLEEQHGQTDYEGLRILAVDEIAIKKGHRYMTVVIDYLTGRVVWMGKDRKKKTLDAFFAGMTDKQKQGLEAIAMDMWKPYIISVRESVRHVKIVFDLFHVVSSFNKVIDKVRNSEKKKASKENKEVFRGAKYLLLKRRLRKRNHRQQFQELLELNETITKMMILRDKLPQIWKYRYRGCAKKALEEWCGLARTIGHQAVDKFINMLQHHKEGILNHCEYQIHTSKLEGINNKIKLIKRKSYGYRDERYFSLKVIQAFAPETTH